jgi:scyllo-inositol 2-dehydrogenase (NADP+)
MPPIRTAVIGFGLAGRVFHCSFIAAVPGLELSAIVQRTGDTAHAAWPNARIFRSVDELFVNPYIDLVVIGTPDSTHFDFAARSLVAGKHVVIDKPVANNSADIRRLIELSLEHQRLISPFQNRRWDGDFLTVSGLLRSRRLGRTVEITSRFDNFRPMQRPNSWREEEKTSSGLLFDLGSHLVDQALTLFGVPDRITGSVRRERDTTYIDDAFYLTLEYDFAPLAGGPLRYNCASTLVAARPAPRFVVHGTLGTYIKSGVDPQESVVDEGILPPDLASPTPWLIEPTHAWGSLTLAPDPTDPTHLTHEILPTELGDYRLFYANVRDSIANNQPLAVTASDALRTITLLELAVQSSHERRSLTVAL